ncbi:MAG TPA: alpha/beta hydrolase [Vicinamibacteria bacterium]|nr:alpha/beta hydrolase [Vicinamibacteria bacterium]
MFPAEGYVTTDDGLRLWFQTVGSGPQVVVLPNGFHLLADFSCLAPGRTLVFYDVRNRGRSDTVTYPALLERGIHNDVDDLDALRRHFGLDRLTLIGHSYMGLMVILYAMKYPAHVDRIVQIGAMGPHYDKPYPADITNTDPVLRDVFANLGEIEKERASYKPEEFCRKFWSVLRVIYVTDPRDADKIHWDRCDLPNERNFMPYWTGAILPSIQSLTLTAEDFAKVEAPVLTVHGTKDRSAPYGGGRAWASLLRNARLLSLEGAGHAPWIEEGPAVFVGIETILRSGLVATNVG